MYGAQGWSHLKKLEQAMVERTHARAALADARARADALRDLDRLQDRVAAAEARVRAIVLGEL